MSDGLFDLLGNPADEMVRTAQISEDGRYRYMLGRSWGAGHRARFIMLNPSTADASQDDPTIRRCIGFARRWGLGGITVVNLYAYRATNPRELGDVEDPVGPENDRWIRWAVAGPGPVVAAWGVHGSPVRAGQVLRIAGDVECLGVTKAGAPRHPLYVRGDTELVSYPMEVAA